MNQCQKAGIGKIKAPARETEANTKNGGIMNNPQEKVKQKNHILKGIWNSGQIALDGIELLPKRSQAVRSHSPDGFSWGYGGSGPAQLALAICLELTDKETACQLYQQFKFDVIAKLPQDSFEATFESIENPNLEVLTHDRS